MLGLELVENIGLEFGRAEVLAEFGGGGEGKIVGFRNHTQKLVDCEWHLIFRTGHRNNVASFLSAREGDLAVELLLQLVDLV